MQQIYNNLLQKKALEKITVAKETQKTNYKTEYSQIDNFFFEKKK